MSRAVMQQALEALEAMQSYAAAERKGLRICDEAITALRATLAESEQPVTLPANLSESAPKRVWLGLFTDETDPHFPDDHEGVCWAEDDFADVNVPYVRADLVAAPTPRKPLTDEEIDRQWVDEWDGFVSFVEAECIVRWTEQRHGITGEQT